MIGLEELRSLHLSGADIKDQTTDVLFPGRGYENVFLLAHGLLYNMEIVKYYKEHVGFDERSLMMAVFTNNTEGARMILEYGVGPNFDCGPPCVSPLSICKDMEMLDLLLHYGADPGYTNCVTNQAMTPNRENIIEKLIKRGADIMTPNGSVTCLFAADYTNMETLLACGVDIDYEDKEGNTALDYFQYAVSTDDDLSDTPYKNHDRNVKALDFLLSKLN